MESIWALLEVIHAERKKTASTSGNISSHIFAIFQYDYSKENIIIGLIKFILAEDILNKVLIYK
jgi:hypothetical protein